MTCDEILKEHEDKSLEQSKDACKKFLDEFSALTGLEMDYKLNTIIRDFVAISQKKIYDSPYEQLFIELSKKHNYNALKEIQNAICYIGSGNEYGSPYITDFHYDNGKFKLSTLLGDFTVFLATHQFRENNRILNYIKYNEVMGRCHNNAMFLRAEFPDSYSVTSLVPHYFGGRYYHSYTYDQRKSQVIDLCINAVMDKENYDELFCPEPVSIVKNSDISREISITEENTDQPSERYPLLKIALYKEQLTANSKSKTKVLSLM